MENIFEKLAEITKPAGLLDAYTTKARQAHNWTSHFPERAGDRLINDYNGQLSEDIAELESKGIDSETIESYKARYINLFTSWLSAKSNRTSSFITGPANYNMKRHERTQRSESNHYTLWQEWRTRAKKAIVRKSQPEKTYISEIDRYKAELEGMQKNHEKMKQGNIMIKRAKKEGKDIFAELKEFIGINDFNAEWAMKWGFGLQNNNANMKRVEQRIKELEQKENMKEQSPITKYSFEGGELIVNYEVDRLQIIFNTRPTSEELTQWKQKGLNSYNWSPSVMAWQRKITANALYSVKRMLPQLTKIS